MCVWLITMYIIQNGAAARLPHDKHQTTAHLAATLRHLMNTKLVRALTFVIYVSITCINLTEAAVAILNERDGIRRTKRRYSGGVAVWWWRSG